MDTEQPKRVGFYVDGCNLYHGMRTARQREFYWLDLASLATEFLNAGQFVTCVKYFTARVGDPGKNKRHSTYIDALRVGGQVAVIEGVFQPEPFSCSNCHNKRSVPKEKQTDTNIAVSMVVDAFNDVWDVAFLVSGDADLVPPIRAIRRERPGKVVIVVHPPCRTSAELARAAHGVKHINAAMLARCQLPASITANGVTLTRPEKWQSE